jgi:[protein-PII] uridylyltransferase
MPEVETMIGAPEIAARGPKSLFGGADADAQKRRASLRHALLGQKGLEDVSPEEIDAHFECMPARYWERVSAAELRWHLRTANRFLAHLVAHSEPDGVVAMDTLDCPAERCTKVLVCTWDRMGLLRQVAGYISALRLNIARAEVYTRADHLALDVFSVRDDEGGSGPDAARLKQLAFLLEGGLSHPPRFVSTWACTSHRVLPRPDGPKPRVTFDNTASPTCTILTVEAAERLGLLHDLLEVFTEARVNVCEAQIETSGATARDVFFLTDDRQKKIMNPPHLAQLEEALMHAGS